MKKLVQCLLLGLMATVLALPASSSSQAQTQWNVIHVQDAVNGILSGATIATHPHLDYNQDGVINTADVVFAVNGYLLAPPPVLSSPTFGNKSRTFTINQFRSTRFTPTGGAGGPYSFRQVGGLVPIGMQMGHWGSSDSLTIQGNPQVLGLFHVDYELEDSAGNKVIETFEFTVVP